MNINKIIKKYSWIASLTLAMTAHISLAPRVSTHRGTLRKIEGYKIKGIEILELSGVTPDTILRNITSIKCREVFKFLIII